MLVFYSVKGSNIILNTGECVGFNIYKLLMHTKMNLLVSIQRLFKPIKFGKLKNTFFVIKCITLRIAEIGKDFESTGTTK